MGFGVSKETNACAGTDQTSTGTHQIARQVRASSDQSRCLCGAEGADVHTLLTLPIDDAVMMT